jgi:hypothetical protein
MPASTQSITYPKRNRSIMLPMAPPSSRPSASESSVFRPELPWYQTMSPTTPIETIAKSSA